MFKKLNLGVVGCGVIGESLAGLLEDLNYTVKRYDPAKKLTQDISLCDIIFLCVPTKADLRFKDIRTAVSYVNLKNKKAIIAIRSTLMPGMTDEFAKEYNREFVYLPEFLRERTALEDEIKPNKIVVGTEKIETFKLFKKIFEPIIDSKKILMMKPVEAELVKVGLNSLYTVKVVFGNELYDICQKYGADYYKLLQAFKLDKYINPMHLDPLFDGYRGAGGKCLLPMTKIYVNNSTKYPYEINIGDKVLTIDGSWQKVINKFVRETNDNKENFYCIRGQGLEKFYLTGEHPIWAIKCNRHYYGNGRRKLSNYIKKDYKFEWVDAKDLKKGDFIALPKIKNNLNELFFNDNLMRFFGYYVAEGHFEKVKNRITIAFHKDEIDYIEDVVNIVKKEFMIDPRVEKRKHNCTVIRFSSKEVKELLRSNCGEMANKKILSNQIMNSENISEFLKGYFRGDGSKSTGIYSMATISERLYYQLKLILLKLGVGFRISIREARIDKNKVKHQKVFTIAIKNYREIKKFNKIIGMTINKNLKFQRKTSWFDKDYFYTPVKEINKIKYSGEVYNFEIEGNQTYVTVDAIVHNCLPKDLKFLIKAGIKRGYLPEMMELANEENESLLEKGIIT